MVGEENSKSEEAQSPDEFVRLSPSGIRDWFWVLMKRVITAILSLILMLGCVGGAYLVIGLVSK